MANSKAVITINLKHLTPSSFFLAHGVKIENNVSASSSILTMRIKYPTQFLFPCPERKD